MHLRDIAEKYMEKGIVTVPLDGKRPIGKGFTSLDAEAAFEAYKDIYDSATGIAIVMGEQSGIIAVDFDNTSDSDPENDINAEFMSLLPPPILKRKGSRKKPSARFFAYSGEETTRLNRPSLGLVLDLQSTGTVLAIPPSKHPDGHNYEWESGDLLNIDPDELPLLDSRAYEFLQKHKDYKKESKGAENIDLQYSKGRCTHGSHSVLSRMAVGLWKRTSNGLTYEDIINILIRADERRNKNADKLYFNCPSRKWKTKDIRKNAKAFLDEILENHTIKKDSISNSENLQNVLGLINWPEITTVKKGQEILNIPKPTISNVRAFLNFFKIYLAFDVIGKKAIIEIPDRVSYKDEPLDVTFDWLWSLTISCNFKISHQAFTRFLLAICFENAFNPIKEWVEYKKWDGHDHIGDLCETITVEGENDPETDVSAKAKLLKRLILETWIKQGVKIWTSHKPIQARGVLTLTGRQYVGKTRWLGSLMGEHKEKYFADGITLDLSSGGRDTQILALSKAIAELGELDATFKRSDISALKAFISKEQDIIRKPYGRAEMTAQRRTNLCASVNDREFLRDYTGNTRYWVLHLEKVNHEHSVDIQQVYAQALAMLEDGQLWYMTEAEMKMIEDSNESAIEADPIWESLHMIMDFNLPKNEWEWLTCTQLARKICRYEVKKSHTNSVAAFCRKKEFEKKNPKGQKFYKVPIKPHLRHKMGYCLDDNR